MAKPRAQNILRVILGSIFLVAAVSKFIDPYPFGDYLNSLRILPGHLILPVVYTLSGLELVMSLLLILNFWAKAVASLFLGIILIATLYSIWLYLSGVNLNCGCFGGFLDRRIGFVYFLTNGFIMVGFSVYLWLAKKKV